MNTSLYQTHCINIENKWLVHVKRDLVAGKYLAKFHSSAKAICSILQTPLNWKSTHNCKKVNSFTKWVYV